MDYLIAYPMKAEGGFRDSSFRTGCLVWRAPARRSAGQEAATTTDEKKLITDAGALCEAVITGQICPRGIPEAEHLLNIARGVSSPSTPLQEAIQNCLYRRFAEIRERVDTARSAATAARGSLEQLEKQIEQETRIYVPPEALTRALDAALEQLSSRKDELSRIRTECRTLEQDVAQHHDPEIERLQQDARTRAKQRDSVADTLCDFKQKLSAVTQLLTKRKARNLLRPDENTEPPSSCESMRNLLPFSHSARSWSAPGMVLSGVVAARDEAAGRGRGKRQAGDVVSMRALRDVRRRRGPAIGDRRTG